MYLFIKLGKHVNHGERMKVTMGIIEKCGVRGDATLCVVIFCLASREVSLPAATLFISM